MTNKCFTQAEYRFKHGVTSCFVCIGDLSGVPRKLMKGHKYASCSPLVESDGKGSALMPMTAKDQCIVAFVGTCEIDATEWAEDKKAPVYDDVDVIKQLVNWPENPDNGESLFSIQDIEDIAQGHHCCIRFHEMQKCDQAPEWLKEQNGEAV